MPRNKRKFKKIYIVCEDNKIFGNSNFQVIEIFRIKESAQNVCNRQQETAITKNKYMWAEQNNPIPQYSTHGFYLVHESFFEDDDE